MTECINSWCSPGSARPYYWDKTLLKNRLHYHLAWEDANQASILPGSVVMHVCDNGRCINPKHLVLGSQAENVTDMAAKGRHWRHKQTLCKNGHPLTQTVGRRICNICNRAAAKASYYRNKEKSHAPG